jgi:hypothetical protein
MAIHTQTGSFTELRDERLQSIKEPRILVGAGLLNAIIVAVRLKREGT